MPNYKGHVVGGIATYALVLVTASKLAFRVNTNYTELILWLILCISGALFPDIDVKSKGQKIFYTLFFMIIIWSVTHQNWQMLSIASIAGVIPLLSRHRGISHNTWFIITVPLIIPVTASYQSQALLNHAISAYVFFVAGALSHLILDFGLVRFLKRSFPQRGYRKKFRKWR